MSETYELRVLFQVDEMVDGWNVIRIVNGHAAIMEPAFSTEEQALVACRRLADSYEEAALKASQTMCGDAEQRPSRAPESCRPFLR